MTRFKCVKFANSVKIGTKEELFVKDDVHDITLSDGMFVTIKHRRTGHATKTTLMNVIYWEEEEPKAEPVVKPVVSKKPAL